MVVVGIAEGKVQGKVRGIILANLRLCGQVIALS